MLLPKLKWKGLFEFSAEYLLKALKMKIWYFIKESTIWPKRKNLLNHNECGYLSSHY